MLEQDGAGDRMAKDQDAGDNTQDADEELPAPGGMVQEHSHQREYALN